MRIKTGKGMKMLFPFEFLQINHFLAIQRLPAHKKRDSKRKKTQTFH